MHGFGSSVDLTTLDSRRTGREVGRMLRIAHGRRLRTRCTSVSSRCSYIITRIYTCLQIVSCHFSMPRNDTADEQRSCWRPAMPSTCGSDPRP